MIKDTVLIANKFLFTRVTNTIENEIKCSIFKNQPKIK